MWPKTAASPRGHECRHQVHESSKGRRYKDTKTLLRQRVAEIEMGTYAGRNAEQVTVGDLLEDVVRDYAVNNQFLERANTSVKHLAPFFGQMRTTGRDEDAKRVCYWPARSSGKHDHQPRISTTSPRFQFGPQGDTPRVKRVPAFPKLKEAPPRKGFFAHDAFRLLRGELPE